MIAHHDDRNCDWARSSSNLIEDHGYLEPAPIHIRRTKKSKVKSTVLDSVLSVIRRSRKGVNIETLRKKTGLGARQLSNALYKLSKRGVITAKSRGVYTKK